MYTHIYDGSVKEGSGVFSTISKLFGRKVVKDAAKSFAKKASEKAINSTSGYASKKAGDKIIQLLRKKNKSGNFHIPDVVKPVKNSDTYDKNLALQRLLAGSGIKKRVNII
mgnify:CR=1 FL=1